VRGRGTTLATLALAAGLLPACATSRSARPPAAVPAAAALDDAGRHALDPLTAAEIGTAVAVLGAEGRLSPDARFSILALDEPSKLPRASTADPLPRVAFAVVRSSSRSSSRPPT
jgi:Cu2+-containing amine oxidase